MGAPRKFSTAQRLEVLAFLDHCKKNSYAKASRRFGMNVNVIKTWQEQERRGILFEKLLLPRLEEKKAAAEELLTLRSEIEFNMAKLQRLCSQSQKLRRELRKG